MEFVHVYSSPHDLTKLFKRMAPLRTPGFIWGQVAGENLWSIWPKIAEIRAATQVGRRIDLLLLAKKVWVSAGCEFVGGVATIAVTLSVDNVAT